MSCRQVQGKLSAWLDGELEPREAELVAAHVDGCASCGAVAGELRQLVAVASELQPEDAPSELFERVMVTMDAQRADGLAARVGRWRSPDALRLWRWAPAAALAAAAAALVAWVVVGSPTRQPGLTPRPTTATRVTSPSKSRPRPRDEALLASAQREFARAETHYRRAIGQLRRIALEDASSWAPARRTAYMRDIGLIEDVVARYQRTARIAPTDPVAQEMLYSAYRRQIRLMQGAILSHPDLDSPRGARAIPASLGGSR